MLHKNNIFCEMKDPNTESKLILEQFVESTHYSELLKQDKSDGRWAVN